MKKSLSVLYVDLKWVENRRLCDLDFTDYIILIDILHTSTQQMTRTVKREADKIELRMNAVECKESLLLKRGTVPQLLRWRSEF